MRTGSIVIFILLMFIPVVGGARISCSNHVTAPDLKLECSLSDYENDSVKLDLKAFDGIPVESWIIARGYVEGWEGKVVVNPETEYVLVPFNFSLDLKSVMREAADKAWLGSEHYWVFYNKENTLTFVVIHKDGRVEERNVTIYVSGKAPSPWEDRDVLHFLFSLGIVLGIVVVIGTLAKLVETLRTTPAEKMCGNRLESKKDDRPKPPEPSRSSFVGSAILFLSLGQMFSPWILYFLATPLRIESDLKLLLIGSVLVGLILEWLVFIRDAKKSGHPYVIREAPITGLEWVPLVMFPFGDWLMFIGILAFFLLFLINQDPTANRLMRKISLPISIFAAFSLILLVRGDAVFTAGLLALAFLHPYLVVSEIKNAPTIGDVPITQRSPEVREILETFDRVLRERRLEGEE